MKSKTAQIKTPDQPMIRHLYSPRLRIQPNLDLPENLGGAKQSFKDECDINQIMAKYQKTGAIAHANKHEPSYGFASSADLQESMNIVMEAQQMFDDLPSSLRKKFGNSPENYLDFVQNPENLEEMRELGLAIKSKTPERVKTTHEEGEEKTPKAGESALSGESAPEKQTT